MSDKEISDKEIYKKKWHAENERKKEKYRKTYS